MALIFYILLLLLPQPVSAESGHIVISEIKTSGQTATDEFVRLYNPTDSTIDISGWKLTKKTSSGAESNLVSSFADGTNIQPSSGFLIAHQTGYLGSETPNARYSGTSYSIADNNIVILKDASGNVVDEANPNAAAISETAPAPIPDAPTTSIASPAEYGDIIINEIMPNPAEGKEWIELLNISTKNLNLSGWKISDGSSIINSLDSELLANNFLTVEIASRLNNAGDAVYLSDASGKSIFQLAYGNWANAQVAAPEKGESLARNPDGNYTISATPTKNAINQFTKSLATADDFVNTILATSTLNQNPDDIKNYITISEILPNPADSDTDNEYIKLFNNGENDLDLSGFYIDDAEGGSNPYKIPAGTIIKSEGGLIFYRAKTKLALNNTDDEARILLQNKEEVFAIDYEDADEGAIYKFQNEEWGWNNTKTKKQENIETNTQSSAKINSITAIVIVPPGLFGTQIMYADGRQLYMYSKDWPELAVGDKIYAFGTPSTYYNEPRLKLKDKNSIKIISTDNKIIPENISCDDFSEDAVGRLISIESEVLEISGKKMLADCEGAEIQIYNKTTENIFSNFNEKDVLKIIGVLSQYNDTFRLLPRSADDLQIIKSAKKDGAVENKNNLWQYAISTLAVGALSGVIYTRRRRNGRQSQMG